MSETIQIDEALRGWSGRAENLIPVLQEIQARFHYLPEEALRVVSRRLRVPLNEVFHVATFYNCFSLEPRGRHLVRVCHLVIKDLTIPASPFGSKVRVTTKTTP